MQAIVYDQFGGPEVLELRDIAAPEPSADEVLIDNHYASVNPIDWKLREGLYASLLKFEFPVVPGWDIAGIVTEELALTAGPVGGSAVTLALFTTSPASTCGCVLR